MTLIKFKNLEKSELVRDIVREKVDAAVERFPKGRPKSVIVTIEMDNSPTQPGPDLFKVRLEIVGGRYDGVLLEKASADVYVALAEVLEHLLERLNRFSDRARVRALRQQRELAFRRRRRYTMSSQAG